MEDVFNDPQNWTAFGVLLGVFGLVLWGKLVTEGAVKREREQSDEMIAFLLRQLERSDARAEILAQTNAKAIEIIQAHGGR